MRRLASPEQLERQRAAARRRDEKQGVPARVHYFHQVDDPFSHLLIQKLPALSQAYSLDFKIHLVGSPGNAYRGDADRYAGWALRDAGLIAAAFGAHFPREVKRPQSNGVAAANLLLANGVDSNEFPELALSVGESLWTNKLKTTAGDVGHVDEILRQGEQMRSDLGHYFGAMLYFQGEWFWGVDRLHLLEARLIAEGFGASGSDLVCPLPELPREPVDASGITLEYFPSLRSPYTAVGHQRVLDLIARTEVQVILRPVMPMMMRGVPAPLKKGRYIMMDAAREARFFGVPFGKVVDPFGEPVKRAFALFPSVAHEGKGMDFVTRYLSAAWAEGRDVTKASVLEELLEAIGLDASYTRYVDTSWQSLLEANVADMLGHGLWGVPSFRVSGGDRPAMNCWGQDRIWLVERDIRERAGLC